MKITATCEFYVDDQGEEHPLDPKETHVSNPLNRTEQRHDPFRKSKMETSTGFLFLFRKQTLIGRFMDEVTFTKTRGGPLVITSGPPGFKNLQDAMTAAKQSANRETSESQENSAQKSFDGFQFYYVRINNKDQDRQGCHDIWLIRIDKSF